MPATVDDMRFAQAAWIDPTARLLGNVSIGEGSSVWPYAVIRCESSHVRIGRFTNLQDHVKSLWSCPAAGAGGHQVLVEGATTEAIAEALAQVAKDLIAEEPA